MFPSRAVCLSKTQALVSETSHWVLSTRDSQNKMGNCHCPCFPPRTWGWDPTAEDTTHFTHRSWKNRARTTSRGWVLTVRRVLWKLLRKQTTILLSSCKACEPQQPQPGKTPQQCNNSTTISGGGGAANSCLIWHPYHYAGENACLLLHTWATTHGWRDHREESTIVTS